MDRRKFLIGSVAVVLAAGTSEASARAWGANGYMTRRYNEAKAAGAEAARTKQPITSNPYPMESMEFDAWATEYNRTAFFVAMTPKQRAAHEAAKAALRKAEEDRIKQNAIDTQRTITNVAVGIAATIVSATVIGAFFVKIFDDGKRVVELKPWEKE